MTRRISIDPERPSTRLIEEAASIVRAGGLVAYPTETFYGLGADPFDPVPVERVFTVKGRPGGLPLPLIVQDESILPRCVRDWRGAAAALAAAFWPGALTLVLPAVRTLPTRLLAGGETVGVRITPHPVAAALARAAGGAIVATSANRSGQASPASARQVVESLGVEIDLILDGGTTRGSLPSTVIDCSIDPPRLIRAGGIPVEEIERILGRRLR